MEVGFAAMEAFEADSLEETSIRAAMHSIWAQQDKIVMVEPQMMPELLLETVA